MTLGKGPGGLRPDPRVASLQRGDPKRSKCSCGSADLLRASDPDDACGQNRALKAQLICYSTCPVSIRTGLLIGGILCWRSAVVRIIWGTVMCGPWE